MPPTIHRINHGPQGIEFPTMTQVLMHVVKRTVMRTRYYGIRSGFICLYSHFFNFLLRAIEKMGAEKRCACPCCGWEGYAFRALDIGQHMLRNVECPRCWCHERHRMLHLVWERHPPAFTKTGGIILHFAPEPSMRPKLEAISGAHVISVDIDTAMLYNIFPPFLIADLHDFPISDNSVAGMLSVHVMEHLRDDRRCAREMLRVLKPGGVLVLMAPFDPTRSTTDEWGKPNPELFDHYRNYSAHDFHERLDGFSLEILKPAEFLAPGEAQRFGIDWTQYVYYASKLQLTSD